MQICKQCQQPFNEIKNKYFCSHSCSAKYQHAGRSIIVKCGNCKRDIIKARCRISQSKSKLNFCSSSCFGIYNSQHKTTGNSRSKLEIWLEEQLRILYPNLDILFNDRLTIKSELDIYIPKLKLAFELNGIYHYEPIHGQDKLNKIQNNDNRKFQACLENDIELCIIDTSSFKNFKNKRAEQYLNIIKDILDKKIDGET